MWVQAFKDVFFFVGSVLGIVAFTKTIIEPMVEGNRNKWKVIKERIAEEDFINLEFDIWEARRIRDETWTVIRNFVRDIEEDAEYLRFNSILKKHYHQSLHNLTTLYWELTEFIQVPYWEPYSHTTEDGNEHHYRQLNKQHFYKNKDGERTYVAHLEAAAEIAEKMRVEFRKLSILSNLETIQIPFARRLITRGSTIPKRMTEPQ
jgi:hypothetical protein